MLPFAIPAIATMSPGTVKLLRNLGVGLLVLVVLGLLGAFVYSKGEHAGEQKIQAAWDLDTKARDTAITNLRLEYAGKLALANSEKDRISNDLVKTRESSAAAIAALGRVHGQRLLRSTERASVYQRLSEAGPTERSGLASHAAELDRSLEEGRSLVAELGITLGQREQEIRLLGQQITSDRKVMGE